MKKTLLKLLAYTLVVIGFAVPTIFGNTAAAASTLDDGTYEIPVTMIKSDSDDTSMGNDYIAHTGLLEVKNGNAYLTIAQSEDKAVSGLEIMYYNDGSVDGDTSDATSVSNVKIGGKTYAYAYKIPLKKSNNVGVKFSASIMPISPSARLHLDYSSAKSVSSSSKTTTKASGTDATTTASSDEETTAEDTDEETTAAEDADAEDTDSEDTTDVTETVDEAASVEEEGGLSVGAVIGIVVAVAAVAVIAFVLSKKLKK